VLSSRDSRAIDFRLKRRVSTPEITLREKLIFQCLFDWRPTQETILTKTLAETNTQTNATGQNSNFLDGMQPNTAPAFSFRRLLLIGVSFLSVLSGQK
jgi:hypothetical protein